jgi:hypothetical protein
MASLTRIAAAAAVLLSGCAAIPLLIGGAGAFAEKQRREEFAQEAQAGAEEDLRRLEETERQERDAAEARHQEARERRLAEAERIRVEQEQQKREEEARRAEEQRAAAEHAAMVEERKRDPRYAIPVLSGLLCYERAVRADALKEIRTEKRYSEIAGVQDNAKLYALQQRVREMDEGIAETTRLLASKGWKALSCAGRRVRLVVACIAAHDAGYECEEEQRPFSEVMGFE